MSSSSFPSTETPVGGTRLRRIAVSLLSTAGIVASGFAAVTPIAAQAAATSGTRAATSTSGSVYTGINPTRVEDTRNDGKTLGPNSSLNVTVTGGTTGVPTSATAVVLNVTTTDTTAPGYITVYPAGATQPTASNQNFLAGATIAAQATTAVGTNGQVTIYNFAGSVDVIVDIQGYFGAAAANGSGRFTPVSPYRAADTRNTFQTLAPNSSTDFQIAGLGIPSTGVQAAVLNFTVTNTQAPGYLAVSPKGSTAQLSSILNWGTAQTIPNRVNALLGTAGFITVTNGSSGSADLVIDVNGYFTDQTTGAGSGSTFTPLSAPARLLDTRNTGGPIGPNSLRGLNVAGSNGIPANATAVVQNLTVTNTTGNSYLSAFPNSRPLASDDNWLVGVTIANAATTGLNSAGGENFYNLVGNVDLIVDAAGYYSPSPGVFVTANPATLPAEGNATPANDRSTIVANVTDNNGNPVNGDNVQFTLGSGCGTGATITPSIVATGTNGQASATFQEGSGSTTAGSCVITATEANQGKTGTVTVTLTAVPNTVTVTPTPSSVQANNGAAGGTSSVVVNVKNVSGANVAGDTVTLTSAGNPAAACGSFSATTGTTDSSGNVTVTYSSTTTPGFCKVTATEAATGGKGSSTITQTTAPAQTGNAVTLSPATATKKANGTDTVTFTANVAGAGGVILGDQVQFKVSAVAGSGPGGATPTCGTVNPVFAATDASGNVTTTYTTSTSAGQCNVTATEANGGQTSAASVVTQTAIANNVALTANPSSLPADGTSKSTVTATVTNAVSGQPVTGGATPESVTFTFSGNCGNPVNTATVTVPTNASGQASTTYTASATAGFCQVSATENNQGNGAPQGSAGPVTITQTAGGTPTVTVTANPTSVKANNGAAGGTSALSATVKTANGSAVPGDSVLFSTSGGATCGTLTGTNPATTNGSGVASGVTYNSTLTPGTCTITATESNSGATGTTTITQNQVPNSVTFNTAPAPIVANGTATEPISINVKDVTGANVSGDAITVTTASSPSGVCSATSLSKTSGTTDSSGNFSLTYTASTTPGFCQVTFTEAATGAALTGTVTQTTNGPQTSNVITNTPATVTKNANGTDTVTVTTQVNGSGGAVAGDQIMYTLTPSVAGACGTLSSMFATTNASGTATVTYTTPKVSGPVGTVSCTISATEANGAKTTGTAGQGTSTVVTENQIQNNITASAAPTTVKAGSTQTSTITATVTSGTTGSAVNNDPVTFAVTASSDGTLAHCGSVSPTSSNTNASGTATSTYTPGATPGIFCTITVTETNTNASTTTQVTQTT